uniref:F-box associated domain-containing protein n=2 Tax=Aegilops tauschii TaxID=37682 RepID=A0A453TBM6_AEGTS
VPPPAGSVLGARRRFLDSIVHGMPDGFLDGAEALAAHGGLLLVRLARGSHKESVHLAVCDLLTGTWNVLPVLTCRLDGVNCTIIAGAEFCPSKRHHHCCTSSPGYSTFFKVLAMVLDGNWVHYEDRKCNLYTFSSTEPSWSAPTMCYEKIWWGENSGFVFPHSSSAVLYRAVVHWFLPYFDEYEGLNKYYTYEVSTKADHGSLFKVSIPVDQLAKAKSCSHPTLGSTTDGLLSLFYMYKESGNLRLDIWTRGNNLDDQAWLRGKVIELKLPRQKWNHCFISNMWWGEKSGTLLIIDDFSCVYRVDVENRLIEEEKCRNGLHRPVPVEIDWPPMFVSRLGSVGVYT